MQSPKAVAEGAYRRGALLGLTLAELLLLLLFLFLMIMAALLFEKDEVIQTASYEAEQWRAGANSSFRIAPPDRPVGYIAEEDMDRPLQELDLEAAEAERVRQQVSALTALLDENLGSRSEDELAELLAELQTRSDRLAAIEEQLGRPEDVIHQALAARPGQGARETILAAIATLEDNSEGPVDWREAYGICSAGLAQCNSDQQSIINEFGATLANLQPGACLRANMNASGLLADGAILHSFDVVLTDDGIIVREGDSVPRTEPFEWYHSWRDALPRLVRPSPYTSTEFVRAFQPFFDRGAVSSEAEVGVDGRPFGDRTLDCRFYVRIYRDQLLADASRSEGLRQAVESVFYKNERGTIDLRGER
jgi:hypothetical protein